MNRLNPTKVLLRTRDYKSSMGYFIDYYDPKTHKRVRRSVGMDRKKAELKRSEIEWKLFRGEAADLPAARKATSFESFFHRYLDHCLKTRSAQSVNKEHGRHETIRKFFLEHRRIQDLQEISPGMIQELQAIYLADHSRKGWNCLLGILKHMLNRAVEWDVIEFNPIAKIKPLKLDKTFHYFSKEEAEKIMAEAQGGLKTAVMILLHTGMRRSELWNLRWRDVNLEKKVITIKPHGEFSTKSRKLRSVPISNTLLRHLKSIEKSDHYVCRPYEDIHSLRKAFVRLLRKFELEGTLHDLRHTFASHLAMAGVPIPVIKELLGHQDIATTMIYAHLAPDIHRNEINKLPF